MNDTHYDLGVSEVLETNLTCCDCGKAAEGNSSCSEGQICDACIASDEGEA